MNALNPNTLTVLAVIAPIFLLWILIIVRDHHMTARRKSEEEFAKEFEDEEGGLLKPDPWTDPE